jgi:DNA-directed RNA polymerase
VLRNHNYIKGFENMNIMDAAVAATRERFDRVQHRAFRDQGFQGTVEGLAVTQALFGKLSGVLQTKLQPPYKGVRKVHRDFVRTLRQLDPDLIAVATLSYLLHSIVLQSPLMQVSLLLGKNIQVECWAAGLLKFNDKLFAKVERQARKRHGSLRYRRQNARIMAKRGGYTSPKWSNAMLVNAGGFLIDCVLEALPDMFFVQLHDDKHFIVITPEAEAIATAAVAEAVKKYPVLPPCVTPPQPWTAYRRGGYWGPKSELYTVFVRTMHKQTRAAIEAGMRKGSMGAHVAAVNALQAVPWKINQRVLDVVQWCYNNDVVVKGLPPKSDIPDPERLSDEDWQDKDKRRLQRYKIAQVKEQNRGRLCDRVLFTQDMATAKELATEQSFFTPFNCDWRGRVYSVSHFGYQRDDRIRALFLFANGMPIGEEGLYWLKVHVANCGDFDKMSKRPITERVAWTEANLALINTVAASPTAAAAWWTKADKPFLFLAACLELTAALASGPAYVTHLPVSWDGSCSGLQHLCAMTRASEGALVNLTPQELPQDVYQTVADLVASRVAADTVTEHAELAKLCLDYGIDRKLVKRNVMTFPYSSRKFGMAGQHVEDLMRPLEIEVLEGKHKTHPFGDDNGRAAARYLASHIYDAISEVVGKPAEAMAFLQGCARALAHEGKALTWTTPTGLPWVNRYHVHQVKRVRLWLADAEIRVSTADGMTKEIDKDRAANGVAPNFVHSLDASHLLLTVNASVAEGITNLATVHDSFGCLAPQATRFNAIIREQFVKMYEDHDVLAEVLACAKRDLSEHNWERLPEVPAKGPLNLKEVLNARYAFA